MRIEKYSKQTSISSTDKVIGSNSEVGQITKNFAIGDISDYIVSQSTGSIIINNPDEEDLTAVDLKLKFKDRDADGDQKGYKIIREDFDWLNIPLSYANSIWEIRYVFDLGNASVILPDNVFLKFNGGFITHYFDISAVNGSSSVNETEGFDGSGTIDPTWVFGEFFDTVLLDKINDIPAGVDGDFQLNASGVLGSNPDINYNSGTNTVDIQTILETRDIVTLAPYETHDFESGTLAGFTTSGDALWTVDNVDPGSGTYSAVSGSISNLEQSSLFLSTTATQTHNTISFIARVSSELDYDFLQFFIDDKLCGEWSGELPWFTTQFYVAQGAHIFKWRYIKDTVVIGGSDLARIDTISLQKLELSTVHQGLDLFTGLNLFSGQTTFEEPILGTFKTFNDAVINTIIVGRGGGNFDFNTVVGFEVAPSLDNVVAKNTVMGWKGAGVASSINKCTGFGFRVLKNLTTGVNNIGIGVDSFRGVTTGSGNVIIGNAISDWSPTLTNHVIIQDGIGTTVFKRNDINEHTLPQQTIATINSGGANSIITREYADAITALGAAGGDLTGTYPNPTIGLTKVTLPKIQNAVANSKILGSGSAGIGSSYSEITLGANFSMSGTTINYDNPGSLPLTVIPVNSPSDFPAPVANVITLVDDYTYFFSSTIDLAGDRIVCGQNTVLMGASSEVSILKSTGLATALITSAYTVTLKDLALSADLVFDIDGLGNNAALDWRFVNFIDCLDLGTIKDVDNLILTDCGILNSKGLKFDGSIDTVAASGCIFSGDGLTGNIIDILSTATITRRFRVIYSAVVATALTVGINVDAAATIGNSQYILDTVNFSGGGTYLTGVTATSNKASFISCFGITNTAVNGQLYMQANATTTVIAVISTFYKVLGTTTASVDNSKYTHSNNRLTNDSAESNKYLISCSLSFTTNNNNVCEFGFYDSVLAAVRTPSKTKSTANGTGFAENISFSCVVQHTQGDYLEIHAANNTGTNNITVTNMNFVITEIK